MAWGSGDALTSTNLNGKSGLIFNPTDPSYGAVGDGITDDTAAFQATLNAANTAGGVLQLAPNKTYSVGLITDTTGTRTQIIGAPGAVIAPTGPTWLKFAPTAGKSGVVLRDLKFAVANGADNVPIIWLEGASSGGIVKLDIRDIDFGTCTGQNGTAMWLRACFNGSVERIFGDGMSGMKGIVFDQRNVQSGNVRFADITLNGCPVALQISKAFSSSGGQNEANQLLIDNVKCVRNAESLGMYNPITLTAAVTAGDQTLTVSSGDATKVANALAAGTPQFVVLADATTAFGDVIRVTSASGTSVSLASTSPTGLANGTILYCGSMGIVLGANVHGVQINTPQFESVGAGVVASHCQGVQITNASAPGPSTYPARLLYATNGSQNITDVMPRIALSGTQLTVHECVNQGTVREINLIEPVTVGSGAGPAAYLATTGSAFGTEANLRFYRSRVREGAYKQLAWGASITPDESYGMNVIIATDNTAPTIQIPTNRVAGHTLFLDIYNDSGAPMGTVTFDGTYHLDGAFVAPANGYHKIYEFLEVVNTHVLMEVRRTGDISP